MAVKKIGIMINCILHCDGFKVERESAINKYKQFMFEENS
jgi:hypothetical protein